MKKIALVAIIMFAIHGMVDLTSKTITKFREWEEQARLEYLAEFADGIKRLEAETTTYASYSSTDGRLNFIGNGDFAITSFGDCKVSLPAGQTGIAVIYGNKLYVEFAEDTFFCYIDNQIAYMMESRFPFYVR